MSLGHGYGRPSEDRLLRSEDSAHGSPIFTSWLTSLSKGTDSISVVHSWCIRAQHSTVQNVWKNMVNIGR